MVVMPLQNPTDKIVFAALVQLVRKVPWGPSRDRLQMEASNLHNQSKAEEDRANEISLVGLSGQEDAYNAARAEKEACKKRADELIWKSELFALAAEARFPRDGDQLVSNFTMNIAEDIRSFKEGGYTARNAAMRDVSEAVSLSLAAEGLELSDLPLPPTIYELIDMGADRPEYVSEKVWDREVAAYYRQMTLDNTPSEFIYGDDADDCDDDHWIFDEMALEREDEEFAMGR